MTEEFAILRSQIETLEARVAELERALRLSSIDRSVSGRLTFIRDLVAEWADVAPLALMNRNKHPRMTYLRHIVWLIAFDDAGITQTTIKDFFGVSQDAVSYACMKLRDSIGGRPQRKKGKGCSIDEAARIQQLRAHVAAELAKMDSGEIASLKESQWRELRGGMELKPHDWDEIAITSGSRTEKVA